MDLQGAREAKEALRGAAVGSREVELPGRGAVGVALLGPGRYGVAVRHSGPLGAALAERAVALAGAEADVREVGLVTALVLPPPAGDRWSPAALQRRVRPLRPGLSIAHERVSAGTLGAFVTATGLPGVLALSNDHVLGDSGRARLGDDVLQPGPADGGTLPRDRVGSLARAVPLDPAALGGERPRVDAALAQLDDVDDAAAVDPTYPVGRLRGITAPDDEVVVEKVGRTTGITRGRITAVELDGVVVEFPVGPVAFDDQVEVTGDRGAFSAGGDSGSLVYRPDTAEAVGLLFAGSERGGDGDAGLTFANPIGAVLTALGATLVL